VKISASAFIYRGQTHFVIRKMSKLQLYRLDYPHRENPADALVPNQRYYQIALPNSDVKLVGHLDYLRLSTKIPLLKSTRQKNEFDTIYGKFVLNIERAM
jgi:hypothetical protein